VDINAAKDNQEEVQGTKPISRKAWEAPRLVFLSGDETYAKPTGTAEDMPFPTQGPS